MSSNRFSVHLVFISLAISLWLFLAEHLAAPIAKIPDAR
jgi:hypothetical protein